MFGCFGKEKLVEEGEDAKDVFRRLIDAEDELPQDTTLEVFGHEWQQGRQSPDYTLWKLEYSGYTSAEWIFQVIKPDMSKFSFYFDAANLKIFLEADIQHITPPIQGLRHGGGGGSTRSFYFEFVNFAWALNAPGAQKYLSDKYGLNSDKINVEVAEKNAKATAKDAKATAKYAKAAAKEAKAETNKAKKLGISPEKYQSGKKYFTGTPEDLRETGFTVGADESIEVQATVHDRNPPTASYVYRKGGSQPEPEHIPTQLIDASMEATPKSPQLPGFIVPTSLNVHDDDMMTRRLNESLEGWTKAQRIEGDDNLVTQRAKAQHLELVNKSQQKHAALQAARVANSRRHTHTTSTHRPPASEFVSR